MEAYDVYELFHKLWPHFIKDQVIHLKLKVGKIRTKPYDVLYICKAFKRRYKRRPFMEVIIGVEIGPKAGLTPFAYVIDEEAGTCMADKVLWADVLMDTQFDHIFADSLPAIRYDTYQEHGKHIAGLRQARIVEVITGLHRTLEAYKKDPAEAARKIKVVTTYTSCTFYSLSRFFRGGLPSLGKRSR